MGGRAAFDKNSSLDLAAQGGVGSLASQDTAWTKTWTKLLRATRCQVNMDQDYMGQVTTRPSYYSAEDDTRPRSQVRQVEPLRA